MTISGEVEAQILRYYHVEKSPAASTEAGLPVTLNADELAVLFARSYDRQGGYQNRFRRWQKEIDRASGVLLLTPNDVAWIWRQGSRPWKGSFQRRTRQVFWRALAELFASLGLAPSVVAILHKGRRAGPSKEAPRRLRDPASVGK